MISLRNTLLIFALLVTTTRSPLGAWSAAPAYNHQKTVQQAALYTALLLGGGWLAHQQLPRLAGQEVYYDSPVFTKVVASILAAIGVVGVTGGIRGAYKLIQLYMQDPAQG